MCFILVRKLLLRDIWIVIKYLSVHRSLWTEFLFLSVFCSQARYRAIHWRVAAELTTPVLWERDIAKRSEKFVSERIIVKRVADFEICFVAAGWDRVIPSAVWHVCMLLLIIKFKGLYCFIYCIIIDANIACFILYWPLYFICWFIYFYISVCLIFFLIIVLRVS